MRSPNDGDTPARRRVLSRFGRRPPLALVRLPGPLRTRCLMRRTVGGTARGPSDTRFGEDDRPTRATRQPRVVTRSWVERN